LDYSYSEEFIASLGKPTLAVHGHVKASKYRQRYPNAKLVTFLREPCDRLRSHFFFWRSAYNTFDDNAKDNPLAKAVYYGEVGFIEFAAHHQMVNHVSRGFIDIDLENNFFFVGLFEHFQHDVASLINLLGLMNSSIPHVRKTVEYAKEDEQIIKEYREFELSSEQKQEITKLHSDDYNLYNLAVELRTKRIKSKN
jgi:hypothetical protein